MMMFHKLAERKPIDGQLCLIKEKMSGTTELNIFHQPQFYWDDSGFMCHPHVVEWAQLPEHVTQDRGPWMSKYWGDELPPKNCECLVCTDDRKQVYYAYFDAKRQKFLGRENVIAHIII